MQFHVVGMGAIGCLVSFHLRRTLDLSHSVTVIHKLPRQVKAARRLGNTIKSEHNGVVLSAKGFRHQCYDHLAQALPRPNPPSPSRPRSRGRERLGSRERPDRPSKPQRSVSEVMLDGFKQSMKDLFNPGADGLLRTGRFWSGGRSSGWRSRVTSFIRRPRTKRRELENIDTLFVCVKAQATLKTIRGLLPRLTPDSTIVLLQNGMGVYEELLTRLFPNPLQRPQIVSAVITHGAWMKGYMHVVHAGVGKIDVGITPDGRNRDFEASYHGSERVEFFSKPQLNLDDIAPRIPGAPSNHYRTLRETIETLLHMEALQVSWLPIYDIQMAMRQKVVVNAVINPITAMLDCKNGKIFKHTEGRYLCQAICREAAAVFRAQWEEERKQAGSVDDTARFPHSLHASTLEKLCMDIAASTAQNVSSMLADVRLHRPTEIKYMTGYLVGLGKKYGVRTPTNLTLYNMIRLKTATDPQASGPAS